MNPTTSGGPSAAMSPVSRAILEHLSAHGAMPTDELLAALTPLPVLQAMKESGVELTEPWLRKRLAQLADLGWVCQETVAGERLWAAMSERGEPVARAPRGTRAKERPAPYVGELVQPRRVDLMRGNYVQTWVPVRRGADDFRALDSVHMGERQPFRQVSAMRGGDR